MMDLETMFNQLYEECREEIIRRLKNNGKYVSGKTAESIVIADNEIKLPDWIDAVQNGRGPGKVPYNFDDILLRWAKSKGLSFANDSQAKSWAYFVSKKIREEGTEQYRKHEYIDIYDTPMAEIFTKAADMAASQIEINL